MELVERARAGDADAFAELATRRLDQMHRTAVAILGHEADAHDATQEALIALWNGLPRLRDPERFEAWALRVLVNSCRLVLKRRGRRQVRELRVRADASPAHVSARPVGSFDDELATHETLERAFERLGADDRALLVLHHLDERSLTEIAAALDVPVGTAKSRLHTARSRLSAALERELR